MDVFLHLLNSTTLITSIALLYGAIQRIILRTTLRRTVLGLIFGAGASLSMLQPLLVSQGVIVDARALFLGFAGAFVGPLGAAIALAMASATRLALGATHAAAIGIASMSMTTALCLLWPMVCDRFGIRGRKGLFLLGVFTSASLPILYFQPLLPDAPPKHWLISLLLIYNMVGTLTLGEVILRDRSRGRRERAARQEADMDPLTGLLNRRGLDALFKAAVHVPKTKGTALFIIDIDHFKSVNDRYGHAVGDRALQLVAQSLRNTMRESDTIVRLGGEEFAVLIQNASNEEARATGERIIAHMRLDLDLEDKIVLKMTSSVGAHYWRSDGMTFETAYEAADAALYAAKRAGRNRLVFTS